MTVKYYLEPIEPNDYNGWHEFADCRLVDYYNPYYEDRYAEIEKETFEGSVCVLDFYRGRSASGVHVLVTGHSIGKPFVANMSSQNLVGLLKGTQMVYGEAKGMFTLIKKGANCFVAYQGG